MPLSHNNHYVPQMYLSRWKNNGSIWVYRLIVSNEKVPTWNKQSIERTASLDRLYMNIFNDCESDDLEHFFDTQFEAPAKIPLDKICDDEKMTSAEWGIVGDYVLAQFLRTPYFYLFTKQVAEKIIPDAIDEIGKKLNAKKEFTYDTTSIRGEPILPMEIKLADEKKDNHSYLEISVVAGKEIWFSQIKHSLEEKSTLRKYFGDLKWSVITMLEDESWPTCDAPVVICQVDGDRITRVDAIHGIDGKNKAVLIPLSPKKVILGMKTRKLGWHIRADKRQADEIRKAIVDNAFLYVYSCDKDESVPFMRPRLVNENEFKRIKKDFASWYDNYKEIEAPLLREIK